MNSSTVDEFERDVSDPQISDLDLYDRFLDLEVGTEEEIRRLYRALGKRPIVAYLLMLYRALVIRRRLARAWKRKE